MAPPRPTAVLFADLSGSTRLYSQAGDRDAVKLVRRCLDALRKATEACGGRVVKTIGDEVMSLFPHPDLAAQAAARMQAAIRDMPPLGSEKMAVRIGFHAGPVIQKKEDVYGDTVNIASRLADQASRGQVLTSDRTLAMLSTVLRNSCRKLYDVTLRGKADEVGLCEFLWQKSPDITDVPQPELKKTRSTLRLRYRDQSLVRRRGAEKISIGRDAECDLVVSGSRASRQHCVIERGRDRFVLRDHSANGTYLTLEGEKELVLRREEHALRGHGWIAFGEPRKEAVDVLEFFCE